MPSQPSFFLFIEFNYNLLLKSFYKNIHQKLWCQNLLALQIIHLIKLYVKRGIQTWNHLPKQRTSAA